MAAGAARGAAAGGAALSLGSPAVAVWGANTDVGKTLLAAGLAAAAQRAGLAPAYLKPVQTGFPADSDARLVAAALGARPAHGTHAAALLGGAAAGASPAASPAKVLFAWRAAVGPHVAARAEGRGVSDAALVAALAAELAALPAAGSFALVEGAGGPLSPGPAGAPLADALRPLRLPALLAGDGRLGGVSATLCALEALRARGYEVPAVALLEPPGGGDALGNAAELRRLVGAGTAVFSLPPCAPKPPLVAAAAGGDGGAADPAALYQLDAGLVSWLAATRGEFDSLLEALRAHHRARVAGLAALAGEARAALWWPFTQHAALEGDARAVTVVDGRAGEHLAVFRPGNGGGEGSSGAAISAPASASASATDNTTSGAVDPAHPSLELAYDGTASWWTQGAGAAAAPALAAAAAAAAARYGHVLFPQTAHAPGVALARRLLAGPGAGWAARAFFSDDGSTAVEVALKMALRKFAVEQRLLDVAAAAAAGDADARAALPVELDIVGLLGAYHGDTLGAMDAVAASVFAGPLQAPWHAPRGLFLDPPTAAIEDGRWCVRAAAADGGALLEELESGAALFAAARDGGATAAGYRAAIEAALDARAAARPRARLAALLMEPLLQGAGGMRLVDPAFQRALAAACRARGMPVILDEVFTGLGRLGAPTGAALAGLTPDVAAYAKLLTGGLLPLAVTLASADVFAAFSAGGKAGALLHGHSYTAHPVGCAVALAALDAMANPALNPNACAPGRPGCCGAGNGRGEGAACAAPCGAALVQWDAAGAARLSRLPRVARVVALGSVLAAELAAKGAGGYASGAAAGAVAKLRELGIHARPLGNVVYVMVTPSTGRDQCAALMAAMQAALA
jgi:dethiobiotin synthetase/adenosylmethionine--8-amino-7-oxononanoate aminotransferase